MEQFENVILVGWAIVGLILLVMVIKHIKEN
jgi:hypothetical protein